MTVYLSGKITGNENWQKDFGAAEQVLKNQGHTVLSPTMINANLNYEDYMHIDFAMIDVCDCVVFLENAKDSPGAKREFYYAVENKKRCFQYEKFINKGGKNG